MPKPCKHCGAELHTSIMCFKRPRQPIKNKRQLRYRASPEYVKWNATRRDWIQKNPPDKFGFWYCYLKISPVCIKRMDIDQLTLDHVLPKGSFRYRHLKHDPSNLKPACVFCNTQKGSRVLDSISYPSKEQQQEAI